MPLILLKTIASGAAVICPVESGTSGTCSTGLPVVGASSNELQAVLKVVFGIIAAISVLIIVIGGLRFVLSQGNPENVAKARETIIYAVVGLVISLLAEVIVSFILSKI